MPSRNLKELFGCGGRVSILGFSRQFLRETLYSFKTFMKRIFSVLLANSEAHHEPDCSILQTSYVSRPGLSALHAIYSAPLGT